jgi:hypothetical protein
VWLTDAELMALVRARAETEQRTIAAVVQDALRAWLVAPRLVEELGERAGPDPSRRVEAVCRQCGHEARKHEPHCIVMGCSCRKCR